MTAGDSAVRRAITAAVPARVRHRLRWLPQRAGYVHGPRLMSSIRKRWVLLRHPHADVRFGRDVYLGPGFSVFIPDTGTLVVGDRVEFRRGFRAEVAGDGRVLIGADSRFTYEVVLQCSTTIEIGKRCMFAQSAIVVDGNHRFRDTTRPVLDQGYDLSPVRIADDVWVGTKCSIMADIGERAVIGANSVVSRPVPPYTVAVGTPAQPIDYFGPPGGEPEGMTSSAS